MCVRGFLTPSTLSAGCWWSLSTRTSGCPEAMNTHTDRKRFCSCIYIHCVNTYFVGASHTVQWRVKAVRLLILFGCWMWTDPGLEAVWTCSYCAEQCVVNSVDKLGVDSWVIYCVKRSVRLSLGEDGAAREGNEERKGRREISFPIVKQLRSLAKF